MQHAASGTHLPQAGLREPGIQRWVPIVLAKALLEDNGPP